MVLFKRLTTALTTTLLTLVTLVSAVMGDEARSSDSEVRLVSYEAPSYPSPSQNVFTAKSDAEAFDGNQLRDESLLTWSTEIESTYLSPSLDGDSLGDINYGFFEAPRVAIKADVNDYQVAVRFWQMNSEERSSFSTGLWDRGTSNQLDAHTIDLEVSKDFINFAGDHRLSFGLRHARLENQYFHSQSGYEIVFSPYIYSFAPESFADSQTINCNGFTAAYMGRKEIGTETNTYLFYGVRGSALYGKPESNTQSISGDGNRTLSFGTTSFGSTSSQRLLGEGIYDNDASSSSADLQNMVYTAEAVAGIEANYLLSRSGASAFFRAMVEYQHWEANIAANEVIYYSLPFGSTGTDEKDILSLIGLSATAGISW